MVLISMILQHIGVVDTDISTAPLLVWNEASSVPEIARSLASRSLTELLLDCGQSRDIGDFL